MSDVNVAPCCDNDTILTYDFNACYGECKLRIGSLALTLSALSTSPHPTKNVFDL